MSLRVCPCPYPESVFSWPCVGQEHGHDELSHLIQAYCTDQDSNRHLVRTVDQGADDVNEEEDAGSVEIVREDEL